MRLRSKNSPWLAHRSALLTSNMRMCVSLLLLSYAGNALACGCRNGCETASDGHCDDGGTGSEYNECYSGEDCDDCGPRVTCVPPYPPGKAPMPPPKPPSHPPPVYWTFNQLPDFGLFYSCFGGLWTGFLFVIMYRYGKRFYRVIRQFRDGATASGTIIDKGSRRVRVGKRGHRTMLYVTVRFEAAQPSAYNASRRTVVEFESELDDDDWQRAQKGAPFEVVYVPTDPRVCSESPVPVPGWFAIIFYSIGTPLFAFLGFVFMYWLSSRSAYDLIGWLVLVCAFSLCVLTGRCSESRDGWIVPDAEAHM